jgi:poly-D-alanine transfer protein DltD
VASRDIYMGAIPWVLMQLALVAVVIFVPQTVTVFLEKEKVIDVNQIQIDVHRNDGETEAERPDPNEMMSDPKK